MAVWSTQAANEFIRLAQDEPLTHMQIQKLVYITHGWLLAIEERRLTLDPPEAWKFGPVYRLIWDALKHVGAYPVTSPIPGHEVLPYIGASLRPWHKTNKTAIKSVYEVYGKLAAFQLSALTHVEGTPWQQVYADGKGKNQNLPSHLIRDHFLTIGQ